MPPDYAGVQIHIPGVYVTPVPNAPFSADVTILSHQKLTDGTEVIRTTINHIARDSQGRIYNERRRLVPTNFRGEPFLLEAHIFDPLTRLNTFYQPAARLARQVTLPPPIAARQMPTDASASGTGQPITITDQYWYAPDLSVYLIVKHDDPRAGEQIVVVTHIDRHEPSASRFQVPDGFKIVDETPPPRQPAPASPAIN
jgi:hypothetical protein